MTVIVGDGGTVGNPWEGGGFVFHKVKCDVPGLMFSMYWYVPLRPLIEVGLGRWQITFGWTDDDGSGWAP